MTKQEFNYNLPKELIAQTPMEPRDHSRLMELDRHTGEITHRHFFDLPELLNPGDVLVINNSRVIPARLYGEKEGSHGRCELLLLREQETDVWECLARPGRRLKDGGFLLFGDGLLRAELLETKEDGNRIVRFHHDGTSLYEILDKIGEMPLPHYITEKLNDNERYQTVYSKTPGSAAAPTAGLHFTPELMDKIRGMGVDFVEVTLHVGLGTFRPVQEDNVLDHKMHTEWYSISQQAADRIYKAKAQGHRVIAVGTTSCRTLEAAAHTYGEIKACSGDTDIFIYPGFSFKVLDGLITNFHLPESTLIMLVSAFAGYDHVMAAYKTAVEEKYRFYSFGDAMAIL